MNKSKVYHQRLEELLEHLIDLDISQILLFGVPKRRNPNGDLSSAKQGIIQNSIRKIRESFGNNFTIFSDVCLCQYNTSGHCGIIANKTGNNTGVKGRKSYDIEIDNDKTLESLGRVSLSLCESGTDFIAPSAMMDGQVLYLRRLLNNHGFEYVKILSYSAKHNSCLYSPFRNNNYLHSGFIDKSTYQCSFNNRRESIREILIDVKEGADWVMIKPSLWYMDIIRQARELVDIPIVVQNVSGEYALLKSLMNSAFNKGLPFGDKLYCNKTTSTIPRINGFNQGRRFRSSRDSQIQRQTDLGCFDDTRIASKFGDNIVYEIDSVAKFILSLKRAGADKIITYFLLDLINHNRTHE
jgi:porphobilinogen synthase